MTGSRGIAGLAGFEGAATGRFSGAPAFDEDFGAALGASFGAGFDATFATAFEGVGSGLIAVFARSPADFVTFGCALAGATLAGTTLADFADVLEAFETTGFTAVVRFEFEAVFPVEAPAPFSFAGATEDLAGLTATGVFLATTVFFPTSCRTLAAFSPDFAAGLEAGFGAADFFATTALEGGAFDAAAFTAGFTLAAALPACDDGRDLEVSLEVSFTGVFAAGWRLLAFAGEFLIESLCVSIL